MLTPAASDKAPVAAPDLWVSAAALNEAVHQAQGPLGLLFPNGGPRPGQVIAVSSTSLLFALVASASRDGAWCVMVGAEGVGLTAAAQAGICLQRLVLIPRPGGRWPDVVAALIDVFDVVVLYQPSAAKAAVAQRLHARVRASKTMLFVLHQPDGVVLFDRAMFRLDVVSQQWQGIGRGEGHLRARKVEVRVSGTGTAHRERIVELWLPAADGAVELADKPQSMAQDREAM